MMELLGPMPRSMALGGTKSRKIFDRTGQLRRIRGLNYWPLHKVLEEKYKFKPKEAYAFANFLLPMLEWDPEKRASAKTMLDHEWLKMPSNYDTRYTEQELQLKQQKQLEERQKKQEAQEKGLDFDDDEVRIETSKLIASDTEQNQADDELSTLSDTHFFDEDDDFLDSVDEDFDDSLSKPTKRSKSPQKKGNEAKAAPTIRKRQKEQIFIQRDIAEGRAFNNSFTGPYPEDNDHLHVDKGPNPQFQFFRSRVN